MLPYDPGSDDGRGSDLTWHGIGRGGVQARLVFKLCGIIHGVVVVPWSHVGDVRLAAKLYIQRTAAVVAVGVCCRFIEKRRPGIHLVVRVFHTASLREVIVEEASLREVIVEELIDGVPLLSV